MTVVTTIDDAVAKLEPVTIARFSAGDVPAWFGLDGLIAVRGEKMKTRKLPSVYLAGSVGPWRDDFEAALVRCMTREREEYMREALDHADVSDADIRNQASFANDEGAAVLRSSVGLGPKALAWSLDAMDHASVIVYHCDPGAAPTGFELVELVLADAIILEGRSQLYLLRSWGGSWDTALSLLDAHWSADSHQECVFDRKRVADTFDELASLALAEFDEVRP